jgi:curved DNA-binding protein CbpA
MATVFDGDRYYSSGDWRTACDDRQYYGMLGFKFGDNPAVEEIKQAFKDRDNWWQEVDKRVRSGNLTPKTKEAGPYAQAARELLQKARDTLTDVSKRSEYDRILREECQKEKIRELLIKFEGYTEFDNKLSSEEKSNFLKAAVKRGMSESEACDLLNKWLIKYKVEEVSSDAGPSPIPFDRLLNKTFYEILGVPEDAKYEQIKAARDREYRAYIAAMGKPEATAQWVVVSKAWECLKDEDERKKYDEERKKPPPPFPGIPLLVVERKSDAEYIFKNVRRGAKLVENIVIRNTQGGLLQGAITSDAAWLEPERNKIILGRHEQDLTIRILTSKIPRGTIMVQDALTITTNGGNCNIPFKVFLEDYHAELKRFQISYVPLAAALFGFFGSFTTGEILLKIAYLVTTPYAIWFAIKRIVEQGVRDRAEMAKLIGVAVAIGLIGGWVVFGVLNILMRTDPHFVGFAIGSYLFGALSYLLSEKIFEEVKYRRIDIVLFKYPPTTIAAATAGLVILPIIISPYLDVLKTIISIILFIGIGGWIAFGVLRSLVRSSPLIGISLGLCLSISLNYVLSGKLLKEIKSRGITLFKFNGVVLNKLTDSGIVIFKYCGKYFKAIKNRSIDLFKYHPFVTGSVTVGLVIVPIIFYLLNTNLIFGNILERVKQQPKQESAAREEYLNKDEETKQKGNAEEFKQPESVKQQNQVAEPEKLYVATGPTAKLQKCAGTQCEEVGSLPIGEQVEVVSQADDWYLVRSNLRGEGYIPQNAVTETKPILSLEDYLGRARFYIKSADYNNAIKEIEEAKRLRPDSSEPYMVATFLNTTQKKTTEAMNDFLEAVKRGIEGDFPVIVRFKTTYGSGLLEPKDIQSIDNGVIKLKDGSKLNGEINLETR